jgi:nucleoside-diphosphate-sugar epimerase
VVDNFATGLRRNLEGVEKKVRLFEGDVCDADLLSNAFEGADYVLHQAALPSVQRSVEYPLSTNRVNVEGTLQVLEASRKASVKRVVYAASSSAYGDTPTLPKHEDMCPHPKSPYAVSKLTGAHYCQVYFEVFGLETVCLCYFNVFGPRQNPLSHYAAVIPIFIRCALEGKPATIFGDGEQSRDFTYVDNVVNANLLAVGAEKAVGKIINVAAGSRHTLNRIVDVLESIVGKKVERHYAPSRRGDVRHSQADISLAEQLLGYRPAVSVEEGLRRTVEWQQRRREHS